MGTIRFDANLWTVKYPRIYETLHRFHCTKVQLREILSFLFQSSLGVRRQPDPWSTSCRTVQTFENLCTFKVLHFPTIFCQFPRSYLGGPITTDNGPDERFSIVIASLISMQNNQHRLRSVILCLSRGWHHYSSNDCVYSAASGLDGPQVDCSQRVGCVLAVFRTQPERTQTDKKAASTKHSQLSKQPEIFDCRTQHLSNVVTRCCFKFIELTES